MKDISYLQMKIMLVGLLVFLVVGLTTPQLNAKNTSNNTPQAEEVEIEPEIAPQPTINTVEELAIPEIEEVIEENLQETNTLWNYNEWDLEILALIIYQEAGGDLASDETRMMVGNVFINRVESDKFPNTFEEVAMQDNQYGLEGGIRWPSRRSNPGERHAVERAYDCALRLLRGERFLPNNVIWQAQFTQGSGVYKVSDGMYFCY